MTVVVGVDERYAVICALVDAADSFAVRAQEQEALRDRVRPGTAVHHLHAHSATLWRSAESSLRVRVAELTLEPGGSPASDAPVDVPATGSPVRGRPAA